MWVIGGRIWCQHIEQRYSYMSHSSGGLGQDQGINKFSSCFLVYKCLFYWNLTRSQKQESTLKSLSYGYAPIYKDFTFLLSSPPKTPSPLQQELGFYISVLIMTETLSDGIKALYYFCLHWISADAFPLFLLGSLLILTEMFCQSL